LSKEILFGNLVNGGIVEVTAVDEKITLKFAEVLPIEEPKEEAEANAGQDNQ
jgi:hypothetical protein